MSDVVVTWPKSRPLESYLSELKRAERDGEVAYYSVRGDVQTKEGERCFHVHDGAIRGYLIVRKVVFIPEGSLIDNVTGQHFPSGFYIERDPEWHPVDPIPMQGFRGFRYR